MVNYGKLGYYQYRLKTTLSYHRFAILVLSTS